MDPHYKCYLLSKRGNSFFILERKDQKQNFGGMEEALNSLKIAGEKIVAILPETSRGFNEGLARATMSIRITSCCIITEPIT